MALCGTVVFVVVVVLLMAKRKEAMASLTKAELAAMLGMILTVMVGGWFLGGPARETRIVLATASSMRNAALALVIAVNSFPGSNVDVAVIAFSGLMIPPNMLFTLYQIISNKRRARRAAVTEE
jgi:BASS family bile acid:Na+ symporter